MEDLKTCFILPPVGDRFLFLQPYRLRIDVDPDEVDINKGLHLYKRSQKSDLFRCRFNPGFFLQFAESGLDTAFTGKYPTGGVFPQVRH